MRRGSVICNTKLYLIYSEVIFQYIMESSHVHHIQCDELQSNVNYFSKIFLLFLIYSEMVPQYIMEYSHVIHSTYTN